MPASHSASASSSSGVRETNAPRNAGIAQNAQRRSQPLASFSEATGPVSSRRRRTVRRCAGVCSSTTAPCPGLHHGGGAARDRGQRQQLAPVARGVRVDLLAGEHRVEPGGDVGVVVEAQHRLGLGQAVGQLPAVPLGHAAGGDHLGAGVGGGEQRLDRVLLGLLDETAGVDDDHVGALAVGGHLPAVGVQAGGQLLGVDLVAGAAQGQQGDPATGGIGRGGSGHLTRVPGGAHGTPTFSSAATRSSRNTSRAGQPSGQNTRDLVRRAPPGQPRRPRSRPGAQRSRRTACRRPAAAARTPAPAPASRWPAGRPAPAGRGRTRPGRAA